MTIYLDSSCNVFISKYTRDAVKRVVLLNALVPVSDKPAITISVPINIEEAKELVKKSEIESYIGHEATAKLLSTLLEREIQVNRGTYTPKNYDIAIIVRLKKRLEKPEDVKTVTLNDVEFLLVRYYTNVEVVVHE